MREAHVGDSKERITWLYCRHTYLARPHKCMTGNNLFNNCHRTPRLGRGSFQRWRCYLTRKSGFVVVEEAAVLDDVFGDSIETTRELRKWNLLTAPDALDQAEIGGGKQADILRVLTVDFFDAFGDDELNTCRLLRVRRSLARRTAAFRQTGNDHREAAILYFVFFDCSIAHTHVNVLAQRFVVVKTDPTGRDLISRDVAHQRQVIIR